jgi:hypothetical protein
VVVSRGAISMFDHRTKISGQIRRWRLHQNIGLNLAEPPGSACPASQRCSMRNSAASSSLKSHRQQWRGDGSMCGVRFHIGPPSGRDGWGGHPGAGRRGGGDLAQP